MSCKLGCGQKGYSSDQKRTIQLIFYLLNCVLLTSTPTPTLNFPLIIMKKIVIMFVQCDKNYAVLMCACPVAPYVSLPALTCKLRGFSDSSVNSNHHSNELKIKLNVIYIH